QPARLLAEIRERSGADAFEISAVRRKAEIKRKHLVLAELRVELNRPRHLSELCRETSFGARLEQPCDLHRQGRSARDDVAVPDPLIGGTSERERIDPVMGIKAPILIREQHRKVAWIDTVDRRGQAPTSLPCCIGA